MEGQVAHTTQSCLPFVGNAGRRGVWAKEEKNIAFISNNFNFIHMWTS